MLFAASIYLARRRRRPVPRRFANTPPLWRLLLEEVAEAGRRVIGATIRVLRGRRRPRVIQGADGSAA